MFVGFEGRNYLGYETRVVVEWTETGVGKPIKPWIDPDKWGEFLHIIACSSIHPWGVLIFLTLVAKFLKLFSRVNKFD